ncbi:WYL domain-containing protein [Prosthecochloris sp. N3]|uniref:WYL domain-containing protein n=1 Tax=Prosthecochloris ethylica TaxID=2743976 RepID=A0ABR9XSQ3_9CHLB|nr:WYL domain-containing protein [Prosthecochloris ethylica]MBF0586687.1 WYL domain-containing protein [Prosthecochloris ethylica]MBF0636959.1 WYL domain-containing protein [Prosthecochloris ethylica]NUK47830.1 WYL domain-containing protein [Prosthecochloris ethylica]
MKQSRPPLIRMYAIDEQLRAERYPNCTSLAGYFEVSAKSVQRDISYMRDQMGAPIAFDSRRNGYYYEQDWQFLPSMFLDNGEAEALKATRQVLAEYHGTPYYEEVSHALDKVLQFLPERITGDSFFSVYSFERSLVSGHREEYYALLDDAIRNHLKVRIEYDAPSTGQRTDRVLHPRRLHYAQGSWYLIAWCELRCAYRAFVVRRIQHAVLSGDHFVPDDRFSPDDYIDSMFLQHPGEESHHIRIRFSAHQARWIRERTWHRTQDIEECQDGGLILSMQVSALHAVRSWVMQYGAEAEVLEPEELRTMVQDEIMRMQEKYEKK